MMARVFELAKKHQLAEVVGPDDITETDLIESQAVFMAGTTLDVIAVNQYEGVKFPSHAICDSLQNLLIADQKNPVKGTSFRNPVGFCGVVLDHSEPFPRLAQS